MWLKIGKKLRTASLNSKFTGSYKKQGYIIPEIFIYFIILTQTLII